MKIVKAVKELYLVLINLAFKERYILLSLVTKLKRITNLGTGMQVHLFVFPTRLCYVFLFSFIYCVLFLYRKRCLEKKNNNVWLYYFGLMAIDENMRFYRQSLWAKAHALHELSMTLFLTWNFGNKLLNVVIFLCSQFLLCINFNMVFW